MRRVIAFAWLALLLTANQRCRADDLAPSQWWVNTGGMSWHDKPGFNGHNPGLALEARWNAVWGLTAGRIARNSEGTPSRFIAGIYTPWRHELPWVGPVHTGALAGLTDGYRLNDGGVIPLAGLVAERRWSLVTVSLVGLPKVTRDGSAALAVFFKWRFE